MDEAKKKRNETASSAEALFGREASDDFPVCTKPFDSENSRGEDEDNPCVNGED